MGREDDVFDLDFKPRITPEEWFTLFTDTTSCSEALEIFANLKNTLDIRDDERIYEKIKAKLTSWKCQSLWDLIDTKAKHVEYGKGTICSHLNVLIIGAGPIGLRTAIETTLLGCRTVIVEKRTEFTRNNVLHLWPFLLSDFRSLGAKKFYGKFCAGAIDHISIRKLQSILLKVCLILGVEIYTGVEFKKLLEPSNEHGWRAQFSPYREKLDKFVFDVVVGADGKKDMLPGFPQIEMRGALAIGITCNFVNENTMEEAGVEEISGVAYQYNPKFFDDLYEKYGVRLENIVYYKDETHYFVMTALKSSLLNQGVFKQDFPEPSKLLEKQNVDLDKLIEYTLNTVHYATDYKLPSNLKLKTNENGTPDIAVFDFTSLKKSANASRIMERKGKRLLLALVGDSLLEPFWPTGSGCGRGVLSALDLAWMIRLYGMKMPPLAVLRERENVFKLLSLTDSKDLQKNYKAFTINPATRYSNVNQVQPFNATYLKTLYDTDDPDNADFSLPEPVIHRRFDIGPSATMPPPKTRRKSVGKRRLHSASSNKRRSDRTTLREARHVSKTAAMWERRIPSTVSSGPAKKTRPSQSGSGSGSCTLESVSESEEVTGPYHRAMNLRRRSQKDQEVSNVFTDSSTEDLDTFEEESTRLLDGASSSLGSSKTKQGIVSVGARGDDEKKGHRFGAIKKLLGKGRDHGAEKRKSIVARRSVSKARKLRRKSGTGGGQSNELRPEAESSVRTRQKADPQALACRKEFNGKHSQDECASKIPFERTVSAKALIAAAEAREKEKTNKSAVAKNDLLKRKADAMGDDTKEASHENVPWSTYLPVVQPLLQHDSQSRDGTYTVQEASQFAGLLLLAVPLLLPCRVRLVGKPSNMLTQKRNTLLRSSTEKRETRKISLTRAGSVQRAVEQLQTKIGQESTTTTYENFRRNRLSGSFNRDSFPSSGRGSPMLTQSTEEYQQPQSDAQLNTDEYEIIDIKTPQPKEYLRTEDDFEVISGSEVRFDTADGNQRIKKMTKKKTKKKPGEILRELLSLLCRDQRLTSVQITLEILYAMHMAINRKPSEEKFYRIYTKGRDFETYVWKTDTCRQFLKQIGWQTCGSFIVLSRSQSIEEPLKCIQEARREVEQLLKSRPHSSKEKPSSNGVLNENTSSLEGVEAIPGKVSLLNDPTTKLKDRSGRGNIESRVLTEEYVNLDDSDASSSPCEDALESSEGYIGDETYLIVDFAVSKGKGKPTSTAKGMEDAVYGKDGRRRRRRKYEGNDEQQSTDIIQDERVPLRQRLRQGRGENGLDSGGEKNNVNKNNTVELTARHDEEKIAPDDLYDERGRRRRNRREKSSNNNITKDDPPVCEDSTRGTGRNHHTARETTTTLTNATKQPVGQSRDMLDRSKTDQHTACVKDKYLSPITAAMAEDDIPQDSSSNSSIFSRLEELRQESSDSSTSDSSKKKKLVLKRGSMRRKKLLEEDEGADARETSKSEVVSDVKIISGVTTDCSTTENVNEEKSESCKQSEVRIEPKVSARMELISKTFSTDGSYKNSSNNEEKQQESIDSAISVKSRIANLMENMNKTDSRTRKDVNDHECVVNGTMINRTELDRDDVKRVQDTKADEGARGKPQGEKKRKLVLKVKRKKNLNVNENNKETIETSPAKSCDSERVESTGGKEVNTGSKGGKAQLKGKGMKHQGHEESVLGSHESANGNDENASRASKFHQKELDVPKREMKAVQERKTEAENGMKMYSNGLNNVGNDIEAAKDKNSTENKQSFSCEEEKTNEIKSNSVTDDIGRGSQETAKPKKKKFVLRRKKKIES